MDDLSLKPWPSQPGLLNQLSLSVIFICSVSTVMFNGNPLLRFDGYAPIASGARILSEHASEMRSCHSVASLEDLARALAGDGRRDFGGTKIIRHDERAHA